MQTHADIHAEINSAQFVFSMRNAATREQLCHAIAILDKHSDHLTPGYRAYYQHLTRLQPPEIVSINVDATWPWRDIDVDASECWPLGVDVLTEDCPYPYP